MTALREIIAQQISATGPITVAEYMSLCLLHPDHGYYTSRDPFGAQGDFITAPEISQMFGELVGLALAQVWLDQGSPTSFTLAELGPGRGTLMTDILRATQIVPGFHTAAQIVLVEASSHLRAMQAKVVPTATFIHRAADLPDQFTLLVANEFFDALPIRQFVRASNTWRERVVGLRGTELTMGLSDTMSPAFLDGRAMEIQDGQLTEYCPSLPKVIADLALPIGQHGGAALIFDYGDWGSLGDTLQAVRQHQKTDPLDHPGKCDLTAHVDFEQIATSSKAILHTRLTPQGLFLERLGITDRARALSKTLSGPLLDQHIAAHRRLTHPDEMGTLFKVIGLLPPDAPALPGLIT